MLGIASGKIVKYEVFVTRKCTGNLRDLKKERLTSKHCLSIIQQMLQMLKQLKDSGKCHNDIKPGNLLFNKIPTASGFDIDLRLGDFGLCDKLGGTPGWSPADFTNKREPGISDLYSVGLVTLYLLCEDEELFYAIRDNFIHPSMQQCVNGFRSLPEVKLILKMIHPITSNRIKIEDCASQWRNIRLDTITRRQLVSAGVHPAYLKLRDGTVQQKIGSVLTTV